MKPHIPTTLLCADTTPKSHLAERAILKCLKQARFDDVKLLTDNMGLKHAVKIPVISGLEGYSNFCIRDMAKHVTTSHALVVQADGYVVDATKWTPEFLNYDYGGACFQPSDTVGNGGFSLRSKKLLDYMAKSNWTDCHPEDSAISIRHRAELESKGFKFMPPELATKLSFEGRSWGGTEWKGMPNAYKDSFGFHSWLSVLPKEMEKPNIFTHAGDSGDTIYSLATMKALGGGVMFLSPDNKYPFPRPSRWQLDGGGSGWSDNIISLLEEQEYCWSARYTHGHPASTTHDLNKFRASWGTKQVDFSSIYQLHGKAFGLTLDETKPWLTVKEPVKFSKYDIVVARTPRYRNPKFPWDKLVKKYGDRMIFVGTQDELDNFNGFAAPKKIVRFRTDNLLDVARAIAGAKVFIGNQSAPLAIAHGLGKNVVVEEWELNANTYLNRPGAIYSRQGDVDIPEAWLL